MDLDRAVALVRARGARAQLVVEHRGDVVLDTAFGCRPGALFWTFSASKPIAALVVHLLAHRGLLDLDAPVAGRWPAFAARGKGAVTTRQVLQHRSGLGVSLRFAGDVLVMHDARRSARRIAAAPLRWRPGAVAAYSPLVSWFVLAELVLRVTGRPLEQVARAELLGPMGLTDAVFGLPAAARSRAVPLHGTSVLGLAVQAVVNRPAVRRAVIPAAGLSSTARDLARIYRCLLHDGVLDGRRILPAGLVGRATRASSDGGRDRVARYPIRWSEGFQLGGPRIIPGTVSPLGALSSPRAFGHNGSNCCIAWADPDRELAFAYLTDRFGWPLPDLRHHAAVADAVLAAVDAA